MLRPPVSQALNNPRHEGPDPCGESQLTTAVSEGSARGPAAIWMNMPEQWQLGLHQE
jgi:hypothetical protein